MFFTIFAVSKLHVEEEVPDEHDDVDMVDEDYGTGQGALWQMEGLGFVPPGSDDPPPTTLADRRRSSASYTA